MTGVGAGASGLEGVSGGDVGRACGAAARCCQVAEFVSRAVAIAVDLKKKYGPKLKDFRDALNKEVRALTVACAGRAAAHLGVRRRRTRVCVLRKTKAPCGAAPVIVSARCQQVPAEVEALKKDVEAFATQFPTVGFEKATMRYKQ